MGNNKVKSFFDLENKISNIFVLGHLMNIEARGKINTTDLWVVIGPILNPMWNPSAYLRSRDWKEF